MPFNDGALGVDFNTEAIEGLIGDRGDLVVHEEAVTCTCKYVNPEKGAVGHANPACPDCRGRGIMYRSPRQIMGMISGLTLNPLWSNAGWVRPGDMLFTPSNHARWVGNFDRVTLTVPYPIGPGQLIVRGKEAVYSPRPPSLESSQDYLFWESGRTVATWLEDEDKKIYSPGSYLLKGRRITWTDGAGPRVGKMYTIKYDALLEFLCWNGPTIVYDRGRDIAQEVVIRRAAVESNPGKHEILSPWDKRLELEGVRGYDDPYSLAIPETSSLENPQR